MRNLFLIFIGALTIILFLPTLQLALAGDDWLALFRYYASYNSFFSHFDIRNYGGNYDAANILMGVISKVWGFNPLPYYVFSIISRITANISIYFLVVKLTKNQKTAILSSLLFTTMFAGIETTNWVFNLTTYISIMFLNLFLFFYIDEKKQAISIKTLFLCVLLFLCFFLSPNRMHGIVFLVPLFELIFIKRLTIQATFFLILRSVIFLAPVITFRILTASTWDQTYLSMFSKLSLKNISYFLHPISSFGSILIPDILIANSTINKTFTGFSYIIFAIVSYFLTRKIHAREAIVGLLALVASLAFLIAPWAVFSEAVFPSESRYLTIPAVALVVSISTFTTILSKNRNRLASLTAYIFLVVFIFANIRAIKSYENLLLSHGRRQKDVENIFKQIINDVPVLPETNPGVFLFISKNPTFLYNAITFGFTPHMILLYPSFVNNSQNAPFAIDSFESLRSIIVDGNISELRRYGYENKDLVIENVYSYQVHGTQLKNTSEETRNRLTQSIEKKEFGKN